MAGEIFIADKKTLDSVKQDTQYIKNQFPMSGGTAWEDYNYTGESKSWDTATVFREWVDVLNISGEGYIKYLTVDSGSFRSPSSDYVIKLRLLKDGETVCELVNKSSTHCKIQLQPLDKNSGYDTSMSFFFRSIDTIFFKNSLKVQAYYYNGYSGNMDNEGRLLFIGGIK